MTQFTRRQMLVGTAATAVAAAIPFAASSPAVTAAPPVGRQASGIYRYKIGTIEVTVVVDGINRMPVTDSFVLNAKKDEVNAALTAAFMERMYSSVHTIRSSSTPARNGTAVLLKTFFGGAKRAL
jgi:hypothetical protein